ncbi:MAG: sialate O-acetylesterase [Prevotellaceae bacterium]|nr:sialate O-acetylesterase [Prevotellaceae bacterium]MDY2748979.1 sialate O-acetylesterase [Prevotella sp.]
MKKLLFSLPLLLLSLTSSAITLPRLFQSGMVLQRQQPLPVWGTANGGETVTVTFRGKTYTTTADADGKWRLTLPKQKPGGPFTMQIGDVTLTDVMVGDVWMVSGQSNIDTNIERVYPQYAADIDAYSNDNIRLFRVNTDYSTERKTDILPTGWKPLTKENAWKFSAIGYFLGQKMHAETGVPQGIIQSSLGGSPIQAWVDIDSLRHFPADYYTSYMLYTDPEYVDYQTKANKRADDVWTSVLNQTDPGYGKYEQSDYDDTAWAIHDQYDNNAWAKHGGRSIIGSIWLRQHITVDAAHAGKAATLLLGTLHDMDYTYINGKQVGVTYYQYPPRRYTIPEGLLREGDNVIAVRIVCKSGTAHFYEDKPHEIVFSDGYRQPISTQWRTHSGSLLMQGPLGGKVNTQNQASVLYNGMIHPLAPYAMQGVIWYQGESNTGRPDEYGALLRKLTGGWRTLWQRPDMPFCVVQLANHMAATDQPQESGWAALREQQRLTAQADPYTSLAVAIDLGEASDIHPLRKREVTERCALALANAVYGKKNLLSPEPVSARLEGGGIVVTMDQPLRPCADVKEVEVKCGGGKFRNVAARTDGNKVIISLDGQASADGQPLTVRYAWKNNPARANVYGKNELPASPFQIKVESQR